MKNILIRAGLVILLPISMIVLMVLVGPVWVLGGVIDVALFIVRGKTGFLDASVDLGEEYVNWIMNNFEKQRTNRYD